MCMWLHIGHSCMRIMKAVCSASGHSRWPFRMALEVEQDACVFYESSILLYKRTMDEKQVVDVVTMTACDFHAADLLVESHRIPAKQIIAFCEFPSQPLSTKLFVNYAKILSQVYTCVCFSCAKHYITETY